MAKRLFVALPVPEPIQQLLIAVERLSPLRAAKWVKAENLHLTLRFLGHQEAATVPALHTALSAIKNNALTLTPERLGTFNGHNVLWMGVGLCDALLHLKQAVDTALAPLGFPREEQPFQPHITLARLKAPSRRETTAWLAAHAAYHLPPFPVTEFILYESRTMEEGVEYLPLHHYPLSAV